MSALARSGYDYESCRHRANVFLLRRLHNPPSRQSRKDKDFLADDLVKAADPSLSLIATESEGIAILADQAGLMVGEDGWLCRKPDTSAENDDAHGAIPSPRRTPDTAQFAAQSPVSLPGAEMCHDSRPERNSDESCHSPATSIASTLSSVDEMILRHPPPELQTRRECGCDTRWASADILDHLIDRGKRPASERARKALLQKFVRSIQSNSARNYCRGHLQQFAQEMGLRVVNTRTPTLVERLRQMAAAPKSLRAFRSQPSVGIWFRREYRDPLPADRLGPLRYFPVAPLHELVNSASLP
jgi:hypothetical protein